MVFIILRERMEHLNFFQSVLSDHQYQGLILDEKPHLSALSAEYQIAGIFGDSLLHESMNICPVKDAIVILNFRQNSFNEIITVGFTGLKKISVYTSIFSVI